MILRTVRLSENQVLRVLVDGVPHVLIALSSDLKSVCIQARPTSRAIDQSPRAEAHIRLQMERICDEC